MGYCAQPTEAMGPFLVEVRRESFKINAERPSFSQPYVYPDPYPNGSQGSVEFLISDIPALRAALDQVERITNGSKE